MSDDAPANVRIVHQDGTETPCEVMRDPEPDPRGLTKFWAIPPPGVLMRPGDRLALDNLPGRSVISVPMSRACSPMSIDVAKARDEAGTECQACLRDRGPCRCVVYCGALTCTGWADRKAT